MRPWQWASCGSAEGRRPDPHTLCHQDRNIVTILPLSVDAHGMFYSEQYAINPLPKSWSPAFPLVLWLYILTPFRPLSEPQRLQHSLGTSYVWCQHCLEPVSGEPPIRISQTKQWVRRPKVTFPMAVLLAWRPGANKLFRVSDNHLSHLQNETNVATLLRWDYVKRFVNVMCHVKISSSKVRISLFKFCI